MIFEQLRLKKKVQDEEFDAIYPKSIQELAETHFTHIEIVLSAIPFLVQESGTKVLDIGSGAGKFCLIGATCSTGHFTGVEFREKLHLAATQIARDRQIDNVTFIHSNITEIDFTQYQAFFFFNSFSENIERIGRIDETVKLSKDLYKKYSDNVKEKLAMMPIGTRLVTYYSAYDEVPANYRAVKKLKLAKTTMWEKID